MAELRRSIVTGELKPGEQILQDALAERFGVSRVPLREALKILEGEGQVTYQPHRGYFVTELQIADLREVYRIRDLLESEAVRVAVPLLTEADLERLEAAADAVDQADRSGDLLAMTVANREFHFTLLEAADMPRLVRLSRVLWDATDAYRSRYYADPGHRRSVHDEHRGVVVAARARDAEQVVSLLREHREHAVVAVSQALAD